jgi:hypothetical protein
MNAGQYIFANDGEGFVTALDAGYNVIEYSIPREQARQTYPNHREYDEMGNPS